jgi:hypothetical protein
MMFTSSLMPMLLLVLSMVLLLLIILPGTTVVAFFHSTRITATTTRIIPAVCKIKNQEHYVSVQSDDYEITSEDEDSSSIRYQINIVLMDKRTELLADTVELQRVHPKSIVPEDNEMRCSTDTTNNATLTIDQMINEVLLSSRLDMPFLKSTKVGPSTIEGAGRGLFATVDINEGEVITCYPGDAVLYEMSSPSSSTVDDENDDDEEEEESYDYDDDDDDHQDDDEDDEADDDFTDAMVLWGIHVPENERWDDDAVFDGSETNVPLTAYAVSVDDQYSVMGHPELDVNPAYSGHYANDGAGHLALEKPTSEANIAAALELGLDTEYSSDNTGVGGVEENIVAYVLKSFEVANAKIVELGGIHVAVVATRDIQADDEIMVTYGPDHWLGYS